MRLNKKSKLIITLLFLIPSLIFAYDSLDQKLSGYILLQVESNGEAWYLNPKDNYRYYLGRPEDAFKIMRFLGIGIKNSDLEKIPLGIIESLDSDKDGLPDDLEKTIGTDPLKKDSDQDGYLDGEEIKNNYNPLGSNKLNLDFNFSQKNKGKIFLQLEKNGEAWYLNPQNNKRYYLGRPRDAFEVIKGLGLGITNENLNKIQINEIAQSLKTINQKPTVDQQPIVEPAAGNNNSESFSNPISSVISAIKTKNSANVSRYFKPELEYAVKYGIDSLSAEGLSTFANIFNSLKFESGNGEQKIYSTQIYFMGNNHTYRITVEKQEDGKWLIANL